MLLFGVSWFDVVCCALFVVSGLLMCIVYCLLFVLTCIWYVGWWLVIDVSRLVLFVLCQL